MKIWKGLWVILLALLLYTPCAFAGTVIIDPTCTDWAAVGTPSGYNGTWVLPASLYGGENSTTYEQPGVFYLTSGLTSGDGTYYILDPDGATVSDVITITGGLPVGTVTFSSDPTLPSNFSPTGNTLLGTEDPSNGFVGSIYVTTTDGATVQITVASDAESYFDPFGAGYDTSDGIQFSQVPIPPTMLLLGSGLLGLVGLGWRRKGAN